LTPGNLDSGFQASIDKRQIETLATRAFGAERSRSLPRNYHETPWFTTILCYDLLWFVAVLQHPILRRKPRPSLTLELFSRQCERPFRDQAFTRLARMHSKRFSSEPGLKRVSTIAQLLSSGLPSPLSTILFDARLSRHRRAKRDTESDTECLGTRPTAKDLWKIWKVAGQQKSSRKSL